MPEPNTRRDFLKTTSVAAGASLLLSGEAPAGAESEKPVRVVVWDERQPAQLEVYRRFLGNAIADHLRAQGGFAVKSVGLDDPEHGLSAAVMDDCDVLIWWGHIRHGEVPVEVGQRLVKRIKAGTLSLIALHSAHWSTPFVEAMYERTRQDFDARLRHALGPGERITITYVPSASRNGLPKADARLTPCATLRKFPDGRTEATVELPCCVFPAYRHDAKPSDVRVLATGHPIVAGVPARFEISQTEMYNEPFHVPEPDELILEERWAGGEWFRSGMVWKIGKGRVFYFRPGHETYPVYREAMPLKIIANAARWLGTATATT